MGYALKTTCDFGEVWEETAPGRDAFSNLMAWPVKKVGHFRADHDGGRWYGNYFPCNEHLKNPAVAAEMAGVCRYLLEERFAGKRGRKELFFFCRAHPEAALTPGGDEYNFYINGSFANYWIRAITRAGDHNLYIHTFIK